MVYIVQRLVRISAYSRTFQDPSNRGTNNNLV